MLSWCCNQAKINQHCARKNKRSNYFCQNWSSDGGEYRVTLSLSRLWEETVGRDFMELQKNHPEHTAWKKFLLPPFGRVIVRSLLSWSKDLVFWLIWTWDLQFLYILDQTYTEFWCSAMILSFSLEKFLEWVGLSFDSKPPTLPSQWHVKIYI